MLQGCKKSSENSFVLPNSLSLQSTTISQSIPDTKTQAKNKTGSGSTET